MLLGLDVGGTFTDGAVVAEGKIICIVKTPTNHDNLLQGILQTIDQVIAEVGSRQFSRIALSTTIVTNALMTGRVEKVGLCIMPGPGMDIQSMLPVEPYVLSGYVDHRGREVTAPRQEEMKLAAQHFASCQVFAISGKFSVRNPNLESKAAQWIKEIVPVDHITIGSEVSGSLNFLRRTNSAYYNAGVWRHFNNFAAAVESALLARQIQAPVYILKADGGTLPLLTARKYPVEGIFTGPAASVLGIMAINPTEIPTISLDIGGTTTDIALWQGGVPLFAEGGVMINGHPTALRGFRLKSVGIGGDSVVCREEGRLSIKAMRLGPAMAVGGMHPTVADAMIVAEKSAFGDAKLAVKAMKQLVSAGQTPLEVARMVLQEAVTIICQGIKDLLKEQASQPVYRVQDIVYGTSLAVEQIIGVGGSAAGLVPLVAESLGLKYQLPQQGMVANAIGAAVARPTVDITLRADTVEGIYTVAELGIKKKLPWRNFTQIDAQQLAGDHLAELAARRGISLGEREIIQSEEFNVIQGFRGIGKIITCRLQVKPGVLTNGKGRT